MIDLDYICFLRNLDNFFLLELEKISILKNKKDKINEFDHSHNIKNFNLKFKPDKDNNSHGNVLDVNTENVKNSSEKIKKDNLETKLAFEILDIDSNYPELSRNLIFGIPGVIKHTVDENDTAYYYHVIIGINIALICVTNSFDDEISKKLVHLVRNFEEVFDENTILNTKIQLNSPILACKMCEIFADSIINDNFIPKITIPLEMSSIALDLIPEGLKRLENQRNSSNSEGLVQFPEIQFIEVSKKIFEIFRFHSINKQDLVLLHDRINGILNIESLLSRFKLDPGEFKQYLLYLWLIKLISFRIPNYEWDVFERTHKSNQFLYDGSNEQKSLIEKHDGGKIISFLSRIDGRCTLADIRRKMSISEIKMMEYVYELIDLELIKKIPCYPILKSIPEEKIPLLIIEGLNQEDLDLIDRIKPYLNGRTTLMDIALKADISPPKMKVIFDKLEKFDLIERKVDF